MILHIDMDAFFASVEQLDNPVLRGKCVIVGRDSGRGVVAAASYEARKKGVHSAMPIFKARQLCPEGLIVPPRMARYKALSHRIMHILEKISPVVEPVSIDEAYVDITGCERLWGSPFQIATKIKQMIREELNLTCSAGVAPLKFLSKIASDYNKPDGIKIIMPEDVDDFIRTLPISKVPGVGKMTLPQLEMLSVYCLGDIKNVPEHILMDRFGKYGKRLMDLAKGMDKNPVVTAYEHKSISTETTLPEDTTDIPFLKKCLIDQADDVARQLRRHQLKARTVFIKVTYSDFRKITRSSTLKSPSHTSKRIYEEGVALLEGLTLERKIRLIGIGTSHLVSETIPIERELFRSPNDNTDRWDQVDKTLDHIYRKFGTKSVLKATLKDKQS